MTPDEVLRLKPPQKQSEGETENIVAPGQMLIFVSGNYPILGTQMLYFLDPVLSARASVKPPTRFVALEDGHVGTQKPVGRTRNKISKPELVPAPAERMSEADRGFVEEYHLKEKAESSSCKLTVLRSRVTLPRSPR
jgi:hypothetical protein